MILEVDSLTKSYTFNGAIVPAVHNVSFSLTAGEFVAIRGRSGCGKSTLLLAAGGLLVPDAGHVTVLGRDIYAMRPRHRAAYLASSVGFVFQGFHLVPYLTVLENLLAPRLALTSRTTASDRREAEVLLQELGLTARQHNRPHQLSVGERQRVAVARALTNRPSLLLADEPTGNLDPENSHQVVTQLRRFSDQGGAVLMVTHHNQNSAEFDRTFEMDAGEISNVHERSLS
ncbi:MAG: ABC transporter ATP-binding protein [Planctomycetota bacterium]|nr:ABC transporter ATP-binding protein [Planctomycetota bacterium]MDA1178411.1 ABC transporter ATP-binding protein [Planctomycetota bacterium]